MTFHNYRLPFGSRETGTSTFRDLLAEDPIVVFDIGARGGIHERWRRFLPYAEYVGFEPDEAECKRLMSKDYGFRCRYFPFALGGEDQCERDFFVCKSPGCSGFLEPNMGFIEQFFYSEAMKVINRTNINTKSLDSFCLTENICPDFLKIDTQGSESEILKSGKHALKKVIFLEIEVEFNHQYKDQALFSDVDRFLRANDFSLLSIRRTLWRRKQYFGNLATPHGGQIVHGDAIYYNDSLLADIEKWRPVDAIKLLFILSAYKQDDFILHLLSKPHPLLSEFPLSTRREAAEFLVSSPKNCSKLLRALFGIRNNKRWRKFIDNLRTNSCTDWHDPDFF